MDTILVTGAAGFIGSHVSEALLRRGARVVGVDNFHDFYDPLAKRRNLTELSRGAGAAAARFTLCEGDIRDPAFLKRVFHDYSPDAVIHLAACAGVRPSIQDPALYVDVNINGTVSVLEAIRDSGISRLVFASSSSVYGNNKSVPFRETDRVDHPISPYAATKKAGELLCHTWHHLHGIRTACLRFFTVYGPRQRPDLAIHKFTRLICEEKPIPFFGDGSTRRDYTFINDIVDGVLRALDWTARTDAGYEVFNLGESHTVSLSEMVQTIETALGKKAVLNRMPQQPGDVTVTYADVSKAREMLGYHPQTSFEQGVAVFVEWYRQVHAQD